MRDYSLIEALFTSAAELAARFLDESQDSRNPVVQAIEPHALIEALDL